jgi:hypothetical protein
MILQTRYAGQSGIINGLSSAHLAFATNALREPTFFEGTLNQPLLLREAMAALYQVVVSDYKYHPRDRVQFFAWLAEQDRKFLAGLGVRNKQARQRIDTLEARLAELDESRQNRLRPFYSARETYFQYAYANEYEQQFLLDPVITVHPDEVSFEAFSRDESMYARLAAKYDLFSAVGHVECGTTNIDFSAKLSGELDRMRTYRNTRFTFDPGGFAVAPGGVPVHKEKKIELPESWVMGFLQVHSTMTLELTRLRLAPVDFYNICRFLRRRKAKVSPRAMRYELTPGEPVRVVFEPWEHAIELTASGRYDGPKARSIRTWGRDRLAAMARLIPVCSAIDVYLAGFGLPTIYVADLGPATFTLALSGWTDNDWTGKTRFDLLARPLNVKPDDLMRVYQSLREVRHATDAALASRTGLSTDQCRSAVSYLCQVGRAMYDLSGGTYRHRDLFAEPFTGKQAASVVSKAVEEADPRARIAREIFESDNVRIIARRPVATGYKLSGSAKGPGDSVRVRPLIHISPDGHLIEAECSCAFARKYKLTQGPCEHILALRLAHMQKLGNEQKEGQ